MVDIVVFNLNNNIEDTLFSIAYQDYTKHQKTNVIIIGKEIKKDFSFFSNYLNISLFIEDDIQHQKQRALEIASCPYIIFINSGDTFYDCFSLENLLIHISTRNVDVVVSNVNNNEKKIYNGDNSIYGKIYKKVFLTKNNIGFINKSPYENIYFNRLIKANNAKIESIDINTYMVAKNNEEFFSPRICKDKFVTYLKMNNEILNRGENISLLYCLIVEEYLFYFSHYNDYLVGDILNYIKINEFNNIEKNILYETFCQKCLEYGYNNMDFIMNPIISFGKFLGLILGEKND